MLNECLVCVCSLEIKCVSRWGWGWLTNSNSSSGVTMIPCRRRRGELHLRKDTLTLCFLQSSYQEASECRVKDGSSLESHTHLKLPTLSVTF